MIRLSSDPVRIVPPADPVVSLAVAKHFLRVDHDEDDALIAAMVAAATGHLDGWQGILRRCLVSQTWRFALDRFPAGLPIELPVPDGRSASISCRSPDGTTVEIAADDLVVHPLAGRTCVRTALDAPWPETARASDAVRVDLVCGFGPPADLPAPIVSAILLMVGDLYRNRETTGTGSGVVGAIPMSTTVAALLSPYRQGLV